MSLKTVGIGVILIAAVLLRSHLVEGRKRRLSLCEELYGFLLHARTRISCYLEPPSRLHIGVESRLLYECGFLSALEAGQPLLTALDGSSLKRELTDEEYAAAREVISYIGTGYLKEQIELLDGGIDRFSALLLNEKDSLSRDVKLINTLSASLAVGIAIVLI